jgi:hypothetical protein
MDAAEREQVRWLSGQGCPVSAPTPGPADHVCTDPVECPDPIHGPMFAPGCEPVEFDHASRAADHVLALVAAREPGYRVTAEKHDTMVALVEAIAAALSSAGGAR